MSKRKTTQPKPWPVGPDREVAAARLIHAANEFIRLASRMRTPALEEDGDIYLEWASEFIG